MSAVITCPQWCETAHTPDRPWGEDCELHEKHFGNDTGATSAKVIAWAVIEADGLVRSSGFDIDIDDASDPEDMEEIAGWCTAAAAFMRETRGAMVSI